MLTRAERSVAGLATGVLLLSATAGLAVRLHPSQAASAHRSDLAGAPTAPPPVAAPVALPVVPSPAAEPGAAGPQLPPPVGPEPPRAGCPVPPYQGPPHRPVPLGAPRVAESQLPAPRPPGQKALTLKTLAGKGIWVTTFNAASFDLRQTLASAQRAGAATVWVRTGGSRQGYYGDAILSRLLPAAHAHGLRVVAWDFPFLSDPVADAQRARRALAAGADAFSPDIETAAEGTFDTSRRVALYLSIVRRAAGSRPVVATVPRPSAERLAHFPYRAALKYADAFAPMIYWSCNEPGALLHQAMRTIGRMLPLVPIGQGYDMGPDGGRRGLPTEAETWRFLDVAKRSGAVGATFWTSEQMGAGQFRALRAYPW